MLAWVFFLAVLGVTMAIPMKRQMINIEQLRFPSGIAAAETLRALHSHGEKAVRAAKALGIAGLLAAVNQFWADGLRLIDKSNLVKLGATFDQRVVDEFNEAVFGKAWIDRTVMFAWDPIFIAAGALTGLRVSASMMLGGTLCWAVFVPILQHQGIITGHGVPRHRAMDALGRRGLHGHLRPALLRHAMAERAPGVRQSGQASSRAPKAGPSAKSTPSKRPMSWFLAGQVVSLVALAWLAHATFDMPVLAKRRGRAADLLPGPGGLPRDRRDRHDAGRRHGQGHAADLRRPQPGQHEHQPDERQHHGRRRHRRRPTC